MRYWLMKCEPEVYSIEDLEKDSTTMWEGVRNYQARNFLRDEIKTGDIAIFYHSNAKPSGPAGVMRVCKDGYPDYTAWDPTNKYYDAKSAADKKPVWFMVDVEFVEKFPEVIPIARLRETSGLEDMVMLQKGSRLSVTPLTKQHYNIICKLAKNTVAP